MTAEAEIKVRFLTHAEGGRKAPIQGGKYGCPLKVGENAFDCRFVLSGNEVFMLGETYQIPIKFLNPEAALLHLKQGSEIELWEGKTIAKGEIIKVV